MCDKKTRILNEVVAKHHPDFVNNEYMQKAAASFPSYFNAEGLIEQTLAHVGGYDFIDGAYEDFSDGSEAKTATIAWSGKGSIKHVTTPKDRYGNVVEKSGPLRVIVNNDISEELEYYFIPKAYWQDMYTCGGAQGGAYTSGKIDIYYNSTTGRIEKLRHFRVETFEELAKKPA